jgi:precorrin-6B methylase 2
MIFERNDRVSTATQRWLEEFELAHPDRNRYEPSGWFFLDRALRHRRVGPDDVFVDFGSGMGRVVGRAARHPFKRVVGIEISGELNEIAREHIDRRRDKLRCQNVELVTADARDYPIPDDMTVAYFFNPFTGAVFKAVLDNIIESIDRRPRTVTLLYANATLESLVLDTGRFRLVGRTRGLRRDLARSSIAIFESC